MTSEELHEILDSLRGIGADTSHVEIKAARKQFPSRLWESISAFANSPGGGVIILGVSEKDDQINIEGIEHPKQMQSEMQDVCARMVPAVRALIEIHRIDGKHLLTVEIPEASYKEKPCYYQGSGVTSGSFIRSGDSDRRLNQYEVQAFLDGRGQPKYDLDAVPEAKAEDLDVGLVRRFIANIRSKNPHIRDWSDEKVLNHYRVMTTQEDRQVPTLAGLLCLGNYPQGYFPGLVCHVLVYPDRQEGETTTAGGRLIDNVKVEGPILTAVPAIIAAIKRNIRHGTLVQGLFSNTLPEYPEVFLREAVVNAFVHRDYSPFARGTAVQIKIFPDRIEISSPGGLFGPVTDEGLGTSNLQAARNSFLIKILEDCPASDDGSRTLCENRGTGIPSMISALKKAGMEPPLFINSLTQFRVVCSNATLFDQQTLAWLEKLKTDNLGDRQKFALAYLLHRQRISNAEYSRMNACDSRVAGKELGELVQRQIIRQHGSRRWAYYTLPSDKSEENADDQRRSRKDRRLEIYRAIQEKGETTRRQLEKELGLKPQTVLYWLRILLRERKIQLVGTKAKAPSSSYKILKHQTTK